MPFTFVHPVVTLPLRKYGIPLSALIIGSMIPDFNYFIFSDYQIGHTLLGQFYFCLPVGLVFFLIFQIVVKKSVIDLFPESQSRKLSQIKKIDLSSKKLYLFVVTGLLIGSFSHIIWDSFTHSYGYAVENIPLLQTEIINTKWGSLKLFKIFQHGSTLIGGIALIWLYIKWYNAQEPSLQYESLLSKRNKHLTIIMIFLISSVISIIKGYQISEGVLNFSSFRIFVGTAVKSFIPIIAMLIFSYSIVWLIISKYSVIKKAS